MWGQKISLSHIHIRVETHPTYELTVEYIIPEEQHIYYSFNRKEKKEKMNEFEISLF